MTSIRLHLKPGTVFRVLLASRPIPSLIVAPGRVSARFDSQAWKQQPVEEGLQFLAASIRISREFARIGDYASDVAEGALPLREKGPYFKPLVDVPRMGELVRAMLAKSLQAHVTKDVETARQMHDDDAEVDVLVGLAGGLGLFLFWVQMCSEGLQKVAGRRLRHLVKALVNRPVSAPPRRSSRSFWA